MINQEEQKRREAARQRLSKYKVIERKQEEGDSMKDKLLKSQLETMQKRQKVEIGAESQAHLYQVSAQPMT